MEEVEGVEEVEEAEDICRGIEEFDATLPEDCKMLLSQLRKDEAECRLKRRWLMGVELTTKEADDIIEHLPPTQGCLPESLLRRDDVYFENVRNCVLGSYGEDSKNQKDDDDDENYCYLAAAKRVLCELDGFSLQAVRSMHRKLRGVRGYNPQLQPRKCGRSRNSFVKDVKTRCTELILKLGKEEPLPQPLANALAVASLALKLKSKHSQTIEFRKFSPEIDALQSDIMKAIWLLDETKVSFTELNGLIYLLDPNALPNKKSRILLRNLLTEYLLECADLENIPDSLLEALTIINSRAEQVSCEDFSKDEADAEVEGVLAVSAQAKQIVWDFLPDCDHDFDLDFANAYPDDLQESDDNYGSDDGLKGLDLPESSRVHSDDSYDQIEGFGESNPSYPKSSFSTHKDGLVSDYVNNTESDGTHLYKSGNPEKSRSSSLFTPPNGRASKGREADSQSFTENEYLAIQEACDKMSIDAYQLIGDFLTKVAEAEGLELHQDDISYLQGMPLK